VTPAAAAAASAAAPQAWPKQDHRTVKRKKSAATAAAASSATAAVQGAVLDLTVDDYVNAGSSGETVLTSTAAAVATVKREPAAAQPTAAAPAAPAAVAAPEAVAVVAPAPAAAAPAAAAPAAARGFTVLQASELISSVAANPELNEERKRELATTVVQQIQS
jgi:hypothetical protein